jgi:hypothetical protein
MRNQIPPIGKYLHSIGGRIDMWLPRLDLTENESSSKFGRTEDYLS